jgi:tripartite ATP-independent transporter DctM subunit
MTELGVGTITFIIIIAFFVLAATGFSISFTMMSIGMVGYLVFIGPQPLYTIYPILFDTSTKDIFTAIPMFTFMAALFQVSGIGERMYDAMYKWMAGIRGGLAAGSVLICTLVAAITGVVATGTVLMGLLAYPEMIRRGYPKHVAIGPVIGGGALGPLIPPSVPMIIVGGLSSVSTGKLFIAGIIPGLLCSAFFITYILVKCYRDPKQGPPIPMEERANWRAKFFSLFGLVLPIALIVVVLGGIYTGIYTPMEAGGIGAFGSLICAAVLKTLTWKNLQSASLTTFRVTGMVLWITIGGLVFASLTGITRVTVFFNTLLVGLPLSPDGVLLLMLGIVFIMGMFIDSVAIMMICIPVMFPVAQQLGFDQLFFAFIFVFAIIIGMITPPFGYGLFYFRGLNHEGVTTKDIYISSLPYVVMMIVVLALCIVFRQIPLYLASQMIR